MTSTRPADILRNLEHSGEADPALARRYASTNDQSAFAELVRRHGPMVWAVCVRVAGNRADAEDAFQAVFLVFIRRLASIGDLNLLGNWLYGVAVRVALKARRSAARRRQREVQVPTMPDPPCVARELTPDLAPVIDEELARLAAHYRDAIVLCDLREVPRAEAAKLLGIPEGTLSSRLANGRKKLAARLAKRGITLSAAAIPATLAPAARASVPIELMARVQQLATGVAAPTAVARLATGDYSVKTSLFFGLILTASVAGIAYAANPADPPQQSDPPKPPVVAKADPAPEQKPAVEGKAEGKVAFTTTPKLLAGQDIGLKDITAIAWSRDGNRLALQGKDESLLVPNPNAKVVPPNAKRSASAVYLVQLKGASVDKAGRLLSRSLAPSGTLVGFTLDGSDIITDRREHGLISGLHQLQYHAIEAREPPAGFGSALPFTATKRESVELEAAETHGYHFAADGKTYRTLALDRAGSGSATKLRVVEVDAATGKTLKTVMTVDYSQHELSPDGKRLAVFHLSPTQVVQDPSAPGGKREILTDSPPIVTFYDADRGAKLGTAKLPPPVVIPKPKGGIGVGGFGGAGNFGSLDPSPRLVAKFSPDGRVLVVSFGLGVTAVYRTDTGEALPALEGLELCYTNPGAHPLTGDGRLLALSGSRYLSSKMKLPRGEEQVAYAYAASFLTVWDTQTGKVMKSWNQSATVAFNPARPLLAILEPNDDETRVGFWDFAAEVEKK